MPSPRNFSLVSFQVPQALYEDVLAALADKPDLLARLQGEAVKITQFVPRN